MKIIQLLWNGFKVAGNKKLYRCNVTFGQTFESKGGYSVMFYGRDLLEDFPEVIREVAPVRNGTEIEADYFETDRIEVLKDSSYWKDALQAAKASEEKAVKRLEKRIVRDRQKGLNVRGFENDIRGCMEHITKIDELIQG